MKQQIQIVCYRTGKLLAIVQDTARMNAWCRVNGYMPHHKAGNRWIVME